MKLSRIAQRLNRRSALELLSALGAGAVLGCGDPQAAPAPSPSGSRLVDPMGVPLDSLSCILTPELDQGPFFVDERLERSDLLAGETAPGITSGSPLVLELGVYGVSGATCSPLTGALVDIWHADVNGLYSDTASGFIQPTDTTGETFLRAYQVVGADGVVTFQTIYPGWYATRTIHVHVKIRRFSPAGDTTFEATTQVFFDDAITDDLFAGSPYLARGPRSIPANTNDQIFNGTGVGREIDTLGPPAGRARPGELAMAALRRTTVDGKPGHVARLTLGIQIG
jgi:protocatechuate 3,4-dioxygenase beta subunit